jgi:GTP diphosphokinase / guanosine-3',5'-bis(diphosphate) 3'-diphosphatase
MIEKKVADDFLHTIASKYPSFMKHFAVIKKACDFALKAHTGQKRKYSGEPFIAHPINVALLCAKRFDDINLLIASLLHDCAEDNKSIKLNTIYELFGKEVGFIVDSVTDTTNHFLNEPEHIFHDRIEKFLYGGIHDIRCILLKLHDREHNINTL